jgi:outer membrane lipoprotein-sorting protein
MHTKTLFPTRSLGLRLGVLAACGTLCASVVSTAAPAGMSAAQIIARNVAARGGEAAWRNVQGIEFIGKMDAARPRPEIKGTLDDPQPSTAHRPRPGSAAGSSVAGTSKAEAVQVPYRLELKRPHKSRVEIDVQGQTAVQVYDGTSGWKLRPFLGQSNAEPFTPEELKLASNEPELDGLLINAESKGTRVSVEGSETIEGHSNYRLKLQFKNGDVRHLWIDAGTFLESRVDGVRKFNGKPRTTYTYFRDYHTVDGVSIPYVLATTIEGQHTTDKIVVDKVVINPELPDSRFAMPLPPAAKSAATLAPH